VPRLIRSAIIFAAGGVAALLCERTVPLVLAEAPAAYTGMAECKSCHLEHWINFRNTAKHKNSWRRIERTKDKTKCYKCHTTGHGKPSGFESPGKTPKLQGLSCESCHGAGSTHVEVSKKAQEAGKMEDPAVVEEIRKGYEGRPRNCFECHNVHIPDKAERARKPKK
jgi:nitrate/TMAO reductase-like tetraheme cytochrome c subunit